MTFRGKSSTQTKHTNSDATLANYLIQHDDWWGPNIWEQGDQYKVTNNSDWSKVDQVARAEQFDWLSKTEVC